MILRVSRLLVVRVVYRGMIFLGGREFGFISWLIIRGGGVSRI